MNTDDSATMTLHEGNTLHVTWQIDGGKADVMIAMKNEVPIYRADEMHRIGCDFLQGYLFSPPVPIEEFKDKCASHVL